MSKQLFVCTCLVASILVLFTIAMVGCSSTVPSTDIIARDGKFPPPQAVQMKYLGSATTDDTNDPMSGCRVYVFKVDGYYQTAVLCPIGKVTTGSAGHEKKKNDDDFVVATM